MAIRVGECGNCNNPVWSDQEYVRWEGMVPIHSSCWGRTTENTGQEDA